jgi:lipid A 4'-phosphatase
MYWRSRLIQLSVVITILAAFALLYFALEDLRAAIVPIWRTANWFEPARQLHWFYLGRAAVLWLVGAAIWWGTVCAVIGFKIRPREKVHFIQRAGTRSASSRPEIKLLAGAFIVGVLATMVFTNWPEIDLTLSRWFYVGGRVFLFDPHIAPIASSLRKLFEVVTWTVGIGALLAGIIAVTAKRYIVGLGLAQWLFLPLVLLIGSGLLVNGCMKNYSARPRPIHLLEFGGQDVFTPVFRLGECDGNCSFVSGEASSIYALGFAIAMLARRRRATLMASAILAGSVIGFIRIGQGGHFLSDIVFAGVLMAMVVALMYWLVFRLFLPRLAPNTLPPIC